MRSRPAPFFLILVVTIFQLAFPVAVKADVPSVDPQELEALVDAAVNRGLQAGEYPGAAVIVTQGDQTLLLKTYGYANLKQKIPWTPDRTRMMLGSTAKIPTAVAVMQQVEAGRLDLNAPVDQYLEEFNLGFRIENSFDEPVRLRHLLTHTAGFDDEYIGKTASDPAGIDPLDTYLRRRMPPVIQEPGKYWAYSNMGIALAGLLAARAAGMDFETYMDTRVLGPLGMGHSSYRQPAPDLADLATGYEWTNAGLAAKPPFYLGDSPAGALTTTAEDWAKFMIAISQFGLGGKYAAQTTVLKPETLAGMMAVQYEAHAYAANKMGWVFWLEQLPGQVAAHHGGYGGGYTAELVVLPEKGAAISVIANSSSTRLRDSLPWEIARKFFIDPSASAPRPALTATEGRAGLDLTGTYRQQRYPHRTWAKFGVLTSQFGADRDFTLQVDGSIRSNGELYHPVGGDLYATAGGGKVLRIEADGRGHVTTIFDSYGSALRRVPWWDRTRFLLGLALVCLAVMISTLYWAFEQPLRRLLRLRALDVRRGPVRARQAATVLSLLPLAVGVVMQFYLGRGFEPLFARWSLPLIVVMTVSYGVVIFTGICLVYTVRAWRERWWGVGGRIYYSLVTLAGVGLSWFAWAMQFLAWRNFY